MLTILIVLGIAYWWYHVPRLDYLPITSSWRTEASKSWLEWAPCVYVRYRVPEAPADLVAKLRPILTLMGEVPLYERSSEELRADLLQVPLDKCQLSDIDTLDWRLRPQYRDLPLGSLPESELAKLDWPAILARHGGNELAIRTDRPFRTMICGVPTGSSMDRRIIVRVIDMGANLSLLEVWDLQTTDR